jgi:hypothetical protein
MTGSAGTGRGPAAGRLPAAARGRAAGTEMKRRLFDVRQMPQSNIRSRKDSAIRHGKSLLKKRGLNGGSRLTNEFPAKSYEIFIGSKEYNFCAMDAFLHFMMSDTTLFGLNIHNWIAALAGFIVIWGAIIVRDL